MCGAGVCQSGVGEVGVEWVRVVGWVRCVEWVRVVGGCVVWSGCVVWGGCVGRMYVGVGGWGWSR